MFEFKTGVFPPELQPAAPNASTVMIFAKQLFVTMKFALPLEKGFGKFRSNLEDHGVAGFFYGTFYLVILGSYFFNMREFLLYVQAVVSIGIFEIFKECDRCRAEPRTAVTGVLVPKTQTVEPKKQ
jgi:hypothetical protein